MTENRSLATPFALQPHEEHECCIHCVYVGPPSAFIDGRCKDCEKKNRPGQTEVERKKRRNFGILLIIAILFFVSLSTLYIFS